MSMLMLCNNFSFIFLVCTIEWITPVHDGPVKILVKSPFMPHLLLSVGGYSFAVWNEGVMVTFTDLNLTSLLTEN